MSCRATFLLVSKDHEAMKASICVFMRTLNPCLIIQVNKDVLVRNSDRFFLEEVGAITKVENLRKREVQVNTRIYYAQKR